MALLITLSVSDLSIVCSPWLLANGPKHVSLARLGPLSYLFKAEITASELGTSGQCLYGKVAEPVESIAKHCCQAALAATGCFQWSGCHAVVSG